MLKRFGSIDLNARNKDNFTPLILAVKLEWKDLVEMFLKHGSDPNQVTPKQQTSLHIACA